MNFIKWILWLILAAFTAGVCILAACVIWTDEMKPFLKWGVFLGLTWMAADLFSVVRFVPWKRYTQK